MIFLHMSKAIIVTCWQRWLYTALVTLGLITNGLLQETNRHDPKRIIQKAVDLAQVAYAAAEPRGCNREIRRELKGQLKLKELLLEHYDKVLTEGQVPVAVNLKGRFNLFVEKSVVVELKNVGQLARPHATQIREYMSKLKCPYGVLVNFPNDGKTSVEAKRFIYKDFATEPDVRVLHAT